MNTQQLIPGDLPPARLSAEHREARRLAQLGLAVGPLNGKRPVGSLAPHGVYDFTTRLELIDSWWTSFTGPVPGVGARPPKGFIVIDVDSRHGGLTSWDEINGDHPLPKTIQTKTGGGGYHYWYRLPYEAELRGQLAHGIDIRHDRNYLVMPGSRHPETGEKYEYLSWVDLRNVPMLPTHLRRLVFKPVRPARPVIPLRLRIPSGSGAEQLVSMVREASPGMRNKTLNTAAFLAAKKGFNVFDDLACAAESAGLDLAEIDATINSGKTAGEKEAKR